MSRKRIDGGGIHDVPGFRAHGVAAGIRKTRRDLAVLAADAPASVGAVFTTNQAAAAPVHLSRKHAGHGRVRALVVNAGIANACTGEQGVRDARRMADVTAHRLGIRPEEVLVSSTGVIGRLLPMDLVESGIRDACAGLTAPEPGSVAEAILTTDTGPKECLVEATVGDRVVKVGGVAKGSGMIHPNMATMLAFVLTDAAVQPEALQALTKRVVDRTFNMVSVDGDTSTNDMVAILASGHAGGPELADGDAALTELEDAIEAVCQDLAKRIARDGEGATTLLEVQVRGAPDQAAARAVARTVAASSLVKSAVFGRDPNWGRIVAAAGRAGVPFDATRVSLHLVNGRAVPVLLNGEPDPAFDPHEAAKLLQPPEVRFLLDLHAGDGEATAWGCDLTYDYVRINAEYTT